MNKILFACDLDNTLIHSYKHKNENDICVEIYNGREQSFMTLKSIALLEKIIQSDNIEFLPVTTRSIEQYRRIEWPEKCAPARALVCNGAILLKREDVDFVWREESVRRVTPFKKEMERIFRKYENDKRFIKVKIVDEMYLFICCEDYLDAAVYTERFLEETFLDVECSGRKVYIFPPFVNKGSYVKTFAEQFGYADIFAAGDSVIDYPMLEAASLAVVPNENIMGKLENKNTAVCGNEIFSDFLLKFVLEKAH